MNKIKDPLFLSHPDMPIKHVLTTKPMAMGLFRNPDLDDLKHNYTLVKQALGSEGKLFFMKQTHTNHIVDVNKSELKTHPLGNYVDSVDGLLTTQPNQILISTFADCIPILIVDTKQKIQVNIHSGWKGTLNGILDNALSILINDYQCQVDDIHILIGPHLLVDDFEVQDDVAHQFLSKYPQIKNLHVQQDQKQFINLDLVNEFFLDKHQIKKNQVYRINLSTLQDERLHSYRKDKEKFQQMALVSVLTD